MSTVGKSHKAAAPGRQASPSVYSLQFVTKTRAHFRKCWQCVVYIFNLKCYFQDVSSYKLVMEREKGIGCHFLHTLSMSSILLPFLEEEKHMGVQ